MPKRPRENTSEGVTRDDVAPSTVAPASSLDADADSNHYSDSTAEEDGSTMADSFDDATYEEIMLAAAKRAAEQRERLLAEDALIEATTDVSEQMKLRRARYACGNNYIVGPTAEAPSRVMMPFSSLLRSLKDSFTSGEMLDRLMKREYQLDIRHDFDCVRRFSVSSGPLPNAADHNGSVYLWRGDITRLEVGAIVNAAKSSLMGGGGIDGAIHRAAGPLLLAACRHVVAHGGGSGGGVGPSGSCPTGSTRITRGFSLPARYVLHTVGPIGSGDQALHDCYWSCLETVKRHNLRIMAAERAGNTHYPTMGEDINDTTRAFPIKSVAFCGVSTGIFGFDLLRATHIALRCVREWMDRNWGVTDDSCVHSSSFSGRSYAGIDSIVFCTFTDAEDIVYTRIMPSYFPLKGFPSTAAGKGIKVAVPIKMERRQRKVAVGKK